MHEGWRTIWLRIASRKCKSFYFVTILAGEGKVQDRDGLHMRKENGVSEPGKIIREVIDTLNRVEIVNKAPRKSGLQKANFFLLEDRSPSFRLEESFHPSKLCVFFFRFRYQTLNR